MPRNITRGELSRRQEPENPIKAHYEFGQFYRIIVKKRENSDNYKLFVERKIINALNEETWVTVNTIEFVEPEDIYSFSSTTDTMDVLTTLAGLLLYKRQDLLVDKLENK